MKITILYGSTTGTTETISYMLKDYLKDHDVEVMNVSSVDVNTLKDSDYILLGSSTWGYGELQDDFSDYIETMTEDVYRNKPVAVFGAGDEAGFSDVFCEAVDIIKEKAEALGAEVRQDVLKVDGSPEDHEDLIKAFASAI